MRDAIGGLLNIQIIIVFMVLVSGYLAFSVNYTKAFRVKNQLINAIEQYDGDIDKAAATNGDLWCYINGCNDRQGIGYHVRNIPCPEEGYTQHSLGFCYKENKISSNSGIVKKQYRVMTFVNIDIPIINEIFERIPIFWVSGDTKTIITHK